MKICFVLPKYQRRPVGGYKIVYEYANRFIDKGEDVSILFMNTDVLLHYSYLPRFVVVLLSSFLTWIEPRWFKLDKHVKKYSNFRLKDVERVKNSDVIIATAISTVDYAFSLSNTAKHVYLIQDFESWSGITDEEVYESYKTNSEKIVISHWLKEIVDKFSPVQSNVIINPIDLEKYCSKQPINERDPYSIGVLYHTAIHKDFNTAFKAILELKELYPSLNVYMFGGFKPDFRIPEWIHFKYNATQSETIDIYNKCKIFLCSSIKEGFGLTGFEAMACGCALVSTNYEGVKEYAVDRYNAILTPIGDYKSIVKEVSWLFEHPKEVECLCENARNSLLQFSWEAAVNKFLQVLYC